MLFPFFLLQPVAYRVTPSVLSSTLHMKLPEEQVLKEHHQTKSGIRVVRKGTVISTYNASGKLIHVIDEDELPEVYIQRFLGYLLAEEIKEILGGHFFDGVVANKSLKIITDTKHLEGSFDPINDWLTGEFIPSLIQITGKGYNAFIVAEDIFSRTSAENFENQQQPDPRYVMRLFDSEEDAMEWLDSVTDEPSSVDNS